MGRGRHHHQLPRPHSGWFCGQYPFFAGLSGTRTHGWTLPIWTTEWTWPLGVLLCSHHTRGWSPHPALTQMRGSGSPTSKNGCGVWCRNRARQSVCCTDSGGRRAPPERGMRGSPAADQVAGREPSARGLVARHAHVLQLPCLHSPPRAQLQGHVRCFPRRQPASPAAGQGPGLPRPSPCPLRIRTRSSAPPVHRPLVSISEVLGEGCGFTEAGGSLQGEPPGTRSPSL